MNKQIKKNSYGDHLKDEFEPTTIISGRGKEIWNLPESLLSLSGDFAITEVRFEGIGSDGLGLVCMAARACCTASCRTSASKTQKQRWETNKTNFVRADNEIRRMNAQWLVGDRRHDDGDSSRERKQHKHAITFWLWVRALMET